VWPDERITRLVSENFLAGRVHPKDGEIFGRLGEQYGAPWTPTTLLLDPQGVERHRIEGFLPVEEFLAQLHLGLGHLAFHASRWEEARSHYREVADKFADTDAAPEAVYWEGVARYKESGDAVALRETAETFDKKYQDSIWSKKASVWKPNVAA